MDALVASILKQDPEARVLLFEDDKCPEWHKALRQRMDPLLQSHRARVEFLPFAPDLNRFRAILSHAAVVLDTPHHGGGTTCNLAFSVGAPVVSLVGETCRGRGPLAYYTLMGIGLDTCIAHDADEYVRKALHIACNSTVRAELSREIVERRSRFARNDAVFREYSDLFRRLAAQPAGARP
jgi:predicted O-linked N-acetylglucosamine transferase (SPINDLY family)